MSEQYEKLRATAKELEEELHSLKTVDDETRTVLHDVLQEVRAVLHEDEPGEFQPQSLTDRLHNAAQEFEGSHPTMAGIINRLIDGLGQMGI